MEKRPERDFSDEVCQPFYWEGNGKHGVLLIHGFTGTCAHMRMIGEQLHHKGFTVMGINLPGHATSMDDMAHQTWHEWLNAAKDAFHQLMGKCEHVSVAGLSMGGCLSLIIGEQMQPTAVATISTPMGTKAPLWLARLAAPIMKNVWWRIRGESHRADDRYDYGYAGFPTVCARHLDRLIKLARQDLHAIQCPLLVVQSHADETITADSAEIILRGASSAVKKVLWIENVPHVCTISNEAANIAEAIGTHFRDAEK